MFNRAMEKFVADHPHPEYSVMSLPGQPDMLFRLMRRMDPGERVGRGKWAAVGEISRPQAQIIAESSHNVEEMHNRIAMLILEHKDTTRYSNQPATTAMPVEGLYTHEQVKDLVRQAVIEYQRQSVTTVEPKPEAVVQHVTHPHEPKSTGVQLRPRKSVKDYQADKQANLDMWTKRADLIGMHHPTLRERDGHIDGRWLRRATKLWEDYSAKTPATASAE